MNNGLTPLECDLIGRIHARYKHWGFPDLNQIRLLSRENTGAGRFTYIAHDGELAFEGAGDLSQGDFSQFDMVGLDAGASFWAYVENRKVKYLEIVVNGHQQWDGTERSWVVCDPDGDKLPKNEQI
jgi:hypothetical protein